MVFCYKIITDTPKRADSASPRRSPVRKLANVPSSFSQLMRTVDYEDISVIESIPEREWRLLTALAKKRDEDVERERLADQFHKMWQQEREERMMVRVESVLSCMPLAERSKVRMRRRMMRRHSEANHQYTTYINRKRQQDRFRYEHQRQQRAAEQQLRSGRLLESIQCKERRWRDQQASVDDMKATQLLNKAIDEEYKAIMAADRRCRQMTVQEFRRRAELHVAQSREREAGTRRTARLKDASQRLAISNELSTLETLLHQQEIKALEAAKRANHAAHAALTSERSEHIARERETKRQRARRIAYHTWQMREDLKAGVFSNKMDAHRSY